MTLVAQKTALHWLSKDDNEQFLHQVRDQLRLCCPAYDTSEILTMVSTLQVHIQLADDSGDSPINADLLVEVLE
jgi:hypothetical protein